ncbi:MAG: AbrB family transcriptional regulator [Desulfuromonadales bacterium]|nr:AbrB family transcriptional regulator [Desulfuromonadales bacterium]
MERILLVIVIGCAGGLLAAKNNFPGGAIVGSMLATAVAAITIPGRFVIPDNISTLIQIMLGITLGMSFDRSSLELIPRIMPVAILSTFVLLGVTILLAWLAGRLGLVSFATALFGLAPGGMSGMALMAQAEGYRIDIVAMLHTVRIFLLFLLVPVISRILQFWTR